MAENKAKVYKGVACLEIASPYGQKWWLQTLQNHYTPVLIEEIKVLRHGQLKGSPREVVAAPLEIAGRQELVVLNLARSDIPELMRRGLWPPSMKPPFDKYTYTEWPEYARNRPREISLR